MNGAERSIFSGMAIHSGSTWLKGHALVVEDRLIKAIIPSEMIKHHLPARRYEFDEHHYLTPGFIDLHIHGARGKDVMDATEEAFAVIGSALAAEGVTGYLATTMVANKDRLEAVMQAVCAAMPNQHGAAILGLHLEGPFIAKEKKGAQHEDGILAPDPKLLQHWQAATDNAIRVVTLAPELPGALELVSTLHKMGVIASIGHTNASYEETQAAIDAGCTQATHLFNAMSSLHQRRPGAAGAILLSHQVSAEIIVDGIHLHPAMVELAYVMKGKDRLFLVTDAMRAMCLGNGRFELGGYTVLVEEGKAMLSDGTLAGSTLRMTQAIKNMVKFTHCTLAEAINLATFNPAKALGLANNKGSLMVGKDADLAVLDADFSVQLTYREGREIYRKS